MKKTEKTVQTESSVEIPDNTAAQVRRRGKSHVPWQRLTLSIVGIIIVVAVWQLATWHLYSLPDHSITAFNSMTNNAFYVIGALVIFFVTGRLIYEWKNASVSTFSDAAQHISEDIKEKYNSTENTTNKNIAVDETVPNLNLREFKE